MSSEYRLFSWGANSHGQLGHGDIQEELLLPREVDLSSTDIQAENIVKIVGGAGHTLLLDNAGRLFSCGWNDKGQAGVPCASSRFQRVESLEGDKIIDVCCGWDSSMALTEDGQLFVWGSNSNGQLGLKELAVGGKTNKPSRLELDVRVQRIAMGLKHSAVVTNDARVFVSGFSGKGQLGVDLKGAKYSAEFLEVSQVKNVKDVACGQHHTVAVTKENELFAWGDNKHGQLGVEPSAQQISVIPIKVQIDQERLRVKKLYCGWTHSAFLTEDNKVLCWGRNSYGQLGRGKSPQVADPWKADSPLISASIPQVSVGSEHNVALTDDKIVVSWGWNEHGNCGNGSIEDVFVPTKVFLPEAEGVLIGTGAGNAFAVVKTNL